MDPPRVHNNGTTSLLKGVHTSPLKRTDSTNNEWKIGEK